MSRFDDVGTELLRIFLQTSILSVLFWILADYLRSLTVIGWQGILAFFVICWIIIIITRIVVVLIFRPGRKVVGYREKLASFWSEIIRTVFLAPLIAGIAFIKFSAPTSGIVEDLIFIQTCFLAFSLFILGLYIAIAAKRR